MTAATLLPLPGRRTSCRAPGALVLQPATACSSSPNKPQQQQQRGTLRPSLMPALCRARHRAATLPFAVVGSTELWGWGGERDYRRPYSWHAEMARLGLPSEGWRLSDANSSVQDHPTTWTTSQQDGPNHLGLCQNAIPEHQMALTPPDCAPAARALPDIPAVAGRAGHDDRH